MSQADEWVSQEFETLAHVLYDYDNNLRLEMVPQEEWGNLIDKSKIFRVVDTYRNNIVLYADSLASPQDILARVWSMDQRHNKVVTNLDIRNRAAEALRQREYLDKIEEQKDLVLFIAKNTKSRWKHDGVIRDEHFRNQGTGKTYIS